MQNSRPESSRNEPYTMLAAANGLWAASLRRGEGKGRGGNGTRRLKTPLAAVDVCQSLLLVWSVSLMRPWHVFLSVHQ